MYEHTRAVELAQALRNAGFEDIAATKSKLRRMYQKGETRPPRLLKESGYRGYFIRYTDPRAQGFRHKFEIHTNEPAATQEAASIALEIVPEARKHFAGDETMVTITWTGSTHS